tara:strand:- start:350 stop:451 length:102 start_codon:yes stop_codon:yes gene_type:complete
MKFLSRMARKVRDLFSRIAARFGGGGGGPQEPL